MLIFCKTRKTRRVSSPPLHLASSLTLRDCVREKEERGKRRERKRGERERAPAVYIPRFPPPYVFVPFPSTRPPISPPLATRSLPTHFQSIPHIFLFIYLFIYISLYIYIYIAILYISSTLDKLLFHFL